MTRPSPPPVDAEPILVLLVDDDRNWTTLATKLLDRTEWSFELETLADPAEALDAIETDPPDCIVSDYRMPGLSGLAFLRAVRERYPELPFILVTSKGTEEVASEAISEGVTDYIQKGYNADHGTLLATRIGKAVRQHRTRAELAASEARYRAVVENVHHAIFILTDGRIQFANSTATDLSGCAEDDLLGRSIDAFVHPRSREAVERLLEPSDEVSVSKRDVEVRSVDDEIRECEVERVDITYDETDAVMLVVTDVTERRRRERSIRRERDAKEAIREVLVNHSTPEGLVEAFCRHVVTGSEYALAWVGTGGQRAPPRAVATAGGPAAYLAEIGLASTDGGAGRAPLLDDEPGVSGLVGDLEEPTVTLVHDGEGTVSGDGGYVNGQAVGHPDGEVGGRAHGEENGDGDSSRDAWRRVAAAHGFGAVASVPLTHNGVDYGVLAVYATDADVFDRRRLRTLSEVGEAVAYALSVAEFRETLMTDDPVLVTLRIGDAVPGLSALQERLEPQGRIAVDRVVPLPQDRDRYFGTVVRDGPDDAGVVALEDATADALSDVTVDAGAEPTALRFVLDRPSIVSSVVEVGGEFRGATVAPDWIEVHVAFPPNRPTGEVVESLRGRYDDVSVMSQWRHGAEAEVGAPTREDLLDRLTEKQRSAVETAHYMGYFEQPRRHYAADVAEALGVSRTTFGHHLRSAHERMYDALFGEAAADDGGDP